jgi:hypothetical protein
MLATSAIGVSGVTVMTPLSPLDFRICWTSIEAPSEMKIA